MKKPMLYTGAGVLVFVAGLVAAWTMWISPGAHVLVPCEQAAPVTDYDLTFHVFDETGAPDMDLEFSISGGDYHMRDYRFDTGERALLGEGVYVASEHAMYMREAGTTEWVKEPDYDYLELSDGKYTSDSFCVEDTSGYVALGDSTGGVGQYQHKAIPGTNVRSDFYDMVISIDDSGWAVKYEPYVVYRSSSDAPVAFRTTLEYTGIGEANVLPSVK